MGRYDAEIQKAYDAKILDPIKHGQLLLQIDHWAARAGINPKWIWTSAFFSLEQRDISYLRCCLRTHSFNFMDGKPGVAYDGFRDLTIKMSAMAGALVRAFYDARVMTSQQVVELIEDHEQPEASLLLIPDFFITKNFGEYDHKRIAALTGAVTYRVQKGLQTVVHIDDLNQFKATFGKRAYSLIKSSMVIFDVGSELEIGGDE